jgi:putative FmdB family regulatory protein
MPIYEYRCSECGADFEKLVDARTTAMTCPTCAGSQVMRRLSLFRPVAARSAVPSGATGGGGCCGGGCGCH